MSIHGHLKGIWAGFYTPESPAGTVSFDSSPPSCQRVRFGCNAHEITVVPHIIRRMPIVKATATAVAAERTVERNVNTVIGDNTEVSNRNDRFAMPGIVDAHTHAVFAG